MPLNEEVAANFYEPHHLGHGGGEFRSEIW
jgi:hypothetical protein